MGRQPDKQVVDDFTLRAAFVPAVNGTYVVTCKSDTATIWTYKMSPTTGTIPTTPYRDRSVALVGLGVVIICVTGPGGLVLLIVTLVRRSGWKKKYGSGAAGYPGAGGAPGTVPG